MSEKEVTEKKSQIQSRMQQIAELFNERVADVEARRLFREFTSLAMEDADLTFELCEIYIKRAQKVSDLQVRLGDLS